MGGLKTGSEQLLGKACRVFHTFVGQCVHGFKLFMRHLIPLRRATP